MNRLTKTGSRARQKEKDTEALIRVGQEYTAKEMEETEFTVRQAIRTRHFWVEAIAGAAREVSPSINVPRGELCSAQAFEF